MTIQPVETEQQFLGNVTREQIAEAARFGAPLPAPAARLEDAILKTFAGKPLDDGQQAVLDKVMQHYVPNAHRTTYKQFSKPDELPAKEFPAAEATFIAQAKQTDLWLDAEEQATRALAEIQDGNINAGIAYLQSALAFAQNYRHSLTEETAR